MEVGFDGDHQGDHQMVLASRVREYQGNLEGLLRGGQWGELSQQLGSLSRTAEYEGQRALCLQAQALSELLGSRGGGRAVEPGPRVEELMDQLLSGLSHWAWQLGSAAGAPRRSEVQNSSLTH